MTGIYEKNKDDRNIWKNRETTGAYEKIEPTGSYGKKTTGTDEKNK
jgi:hypothetical protein